MSAPSWGDPNYFMENATFWKVQIFEGCEFWDEKLCRNPNFMM
jgi:hypothetical protein